MASIADPAPVSSVDSASDRVSRGPKRRWLVASALLLLPVAAVLLWEGGGLKYRFTAKRWGVVIPGQIYRSGQISKWVLEDQIKAFHIGAVIDLNGVERNDPHQHSEIEVVPRLGLPHYRFPLRGDGTGDIARYADAIETLEKCRKSGVPVLVHCSAGAQRTGGVVASYRVLVQHWSTEEARDEMQKYAFNPSRDEELLPYLNEKIAELAKLLVERGVLEAVPEPMPQFRL